MKTWKAEALVVGLVLVVGTTFAASSAPTARAAAAEILGGCAVLLTFFHGQIATRLQEAEQARPVPHVECHRWLQRYWAGKELLWLAAFLLWGAWTALLGVGLFLAYPVWRRWRPRLARPP